VSDIIHEYNSQKELTQAIIQALSDSNAQMELTGELIAQGVRKDPQYIHTLVKVTKGLVSRQYLNRLEMLGRGALDVRLVNASGLVYRALSRCTKSVQENAMDHGIPVLEVGSRGKVSHRMVMPEDVDPSTVPEIFADTHIREAQGQYQFRKNKERQAEEARKRAQEHKDKIKVIPADQVALPPMNWDLKGDQVVITTPGLPDLKIKLSDILKKKYA